MLPLQRCTGQRSRMRALCWIQETAEASAPGSLQSRGRTLFFPSPKQQKSCRPSSPQPASPRCIHRSQGEGSRASTKHPHPWELCQGPLGQRATADWRARAPRSTCPGSSTQPTLTRGSCWLENSLGRGKSFAPLPFWCSPAAQWGYGHCVRSLCAKLPGWEPKGPNQLVPVPPACLAWGSARAGRSLAEAAQSCLLQQPPTCSGQLSRALCSHSPERVASCRLRRQQDKPHTGRTLPGSWSQAGTLPEAQRGIFKQGLSPNRNLLSASLPSTRRAEEELHPWTRTIFISQTQNCTGG